MSVAVGLCPNTRSVSKQFLLAVINEADDRSKMASGIFLTTHSHFTMCSCNCMGLWRIE